MRFSSILAIFALFWAMSFFLVLPFRLRSSNAPEAHVPGQAESAPPRFSFGRTCLWTTIVAVVLFGLYYANYVNQWLPVERLDFVPDSVIDPSTSSGERNDDQRRSRSIAWARTT